MNISIAQLNEYFHHRLLEHLYDGVYVVDRERRIVFWSSGAERITGRPEGQMLGIILGSDLFQQYNQEGDVLPQSDCPLIAALTDGRVHEARVYLRHAEGYPIPVLVKSFPIHDTGHHMIGAAELFSENPKLLRMKRREESMGLTIAYDPLTQVGNRKHLEGKLRSALLENQYNDHPFGVLFIDIDHFKAFNDTYGHIVGDKVLRAVANTLRHNLRETDTCGRWGGEEFLAIVFNVDNDLLRSIAEQLRRLVTQAAVSTGENSPTVTISIGATLAREDDTLDSLIHRADKLMYNSKTEGRNRVSLG